MPAIERLEPTDRLSRVVAYGDLIFLSGMTAPASIPGLEDQVRDILGQIDARLAKVGSDKRHLLSATIWLTDIRNFDAMNKVWEAWVDKAALPARATVEARLANPALHVEIAIVAAKAAKAS